MNGKERDELREKVAHLPMSPGCYIFHDADGTVIYVGKAKHLRNRVSSYFVNSSSHTAKVRIMVRQIASLEYRIVDSEMDALLLENSLIKLYRPKYNILLKDDKTYPWIVIRREPFPRIMSTRTIVHDGSEYFGPYGSATAQRTILDFIREMMPLRTCKLDLASAKVRAGKYSKCLQYHLHNCLGPCIGELDESQYSQYIDIARSILKGDLRPVREYLQAEMDKASTELRFEVAQGFKVRMESLEKYRAKSVIVNAGITDLDVFTVLQEEEDTYCNFIRVRNGSIVAIQTLQVDAGIDSDRRQVLTVAIQHFMDNVTHGLSKEVLVETLPLTELFEGTRFTVPKRGERRALLDFSLRTARLHRAEQIRNQEIRNPERRTERLMEALRRELRLEKQPRHIECFDNSNTVGTYPVAACVVFRDGMPSKKEYRHFNIRTVEGPDDFASMREIVYRRYRRMLDEGQTLPDLVIVDGGKGQLSSAYAVLEELGIEKRLPIVGLAERLEEIYYPFDPNPYYLSRTGEPLKVVCHIRDEAHRFGITFHRDKRTKGMIRSSLDGIPGIGDKTKAALLRHFRTIRAIREASSEEIAGVVGKARAEKIAGKL